MPPVLDFGMVTWRAHRLLLTCHPRLRPPSAAQLSMIFANVSEADIIAKVWGWGTHCTPLARRTACSGTSTATCTETCPSQHQVASCSTHHHPAPSSPRPLQDRLDALAKAHPKQFSIHYIVDRASSSSWKGRWARGGRAVFGCSWPAALTLQPWDSRTTH